MNLGWKNLGKDGLRTGRRPNLHINEGAGQMSRAPAVEACALRVAPEIDCQLAGRCLRRGKDA